MAKILKSDFRQGFVSQLTADWLNTVARRLNNIRMVNAQVEIDEYGVDIYPDVYGWGIGDAPKSFDFIGKKIVKGEKPIITIKDGYANLQGASPILVPEKDHELDKDVALYYIYAEIDESTPLYTTYSQIGGTRPQTVAGVWRKILYELKTVDGIPTILWDRRQDFDIGSPI